MSSSLKNLISRLALSDLEKLAGVSIIRAVRNAYDTDNKNELAQLIIDRYGAKILFEKTLRKSLIASLDLNDANQICNELNIPLLETNNPYEAIEKIDQKFTSGSFNETKAREFVKIFKLSEELIPKNEEDARPNKEIIKSEYGKNIISKGVLHPYQIRIKDKVAEQISDHIKRIIIQMPTGAGKTMTALELFCDSIRSFKFNGFIVWLVDSNELADQAYESFKSLWQLRGDREINIYRFFGKFENNFATEEKGVVFAGFDKSYSALDGNNLENFLNLVKKTSLLIVDEAHKSMADTYFTTIRKFLEYDSTLIGLSATPTSYEDADETRNFVSLFGSNLVKVEDDNGNPVDNPIKYLQDEKYLAKLNEEPLITETKIEEKVDEQKACKILAEDARRNALIIEKIKNSVEKKEKTIVFACTKDHVLALVALLRSKNISAGFVIGETSSSQRNLYLNQFKKGELYVLINHEILATGIDLPNVNKLIITRPIGSSVLYSQIMGRALRGPKNGGNEQNTIINVKDNMINYLSLDLIYEGFAQQFR